MKVVDYEYLQVMRDSSSAIKLLRAANLPFIGSFLFDVFISKNKHSIPYEELIHQLEYYLMDLKDIHGEEAYPMLAKDYIDEWVNEKPGYLRKYLPLDGNEPECDILPDVEKTLRWLEELQGREFVGTESRLKMVVDLIDDLVMGTTENQEEKLIRLQQEKERINQEIILTKSGMATGFNSTQIKEKMFIISDASQRLIGDFRQVESNFRGLDRATRKKISLSDKNKGDLLGEILIDQDSIDDSDEGSSFSAFFEMIMTPRMKNKLKVDLKKLLSLDETKNLVTNDHLLKNIYKLLLEAGSRVNLTKNLITEQLSRFIQEQNYENRLASNLIRETEALLHSFDEIPIIDIYIPGTSIDINPIMSLKMYNPKDKVDIASSFEESDEDYDVDLTPLLRHSSVDEDLLIKNIINLLKKSSGQISISSIIAEHPVKYGLEEALTYFKIAKDQKIPAVIDEDTLIAIHWSNNGLDQSIKIPNILFSRSF